MKVMIVGDPHGRRSILEYQTKAEQLGCDHVVFLGDCWDVTMHYPDGPHIWCMLGNHESLDYGDDSFQRSNITVLPKNGSVFTIDGVVFAQFGGIDFNGHLQLKVSNPRLWYAIMHSGTDIACFSPGDVYHRLIRPGYNVDVLLTHDAPHPFYIAGEAVGSKFITHMIHTLNPQLHLNGHMHLYQRKDFVYTDSIALDNCDEPYSSSVVIYDTSDRKHSVLKV